MEQNVNQEMIDTTDCLEAVSVMKGMKNLFFWLLFLSLLVVQGVFWLNTLGFIEKGDCQVCDAVKADQKAVWTGTTGNARLWFGAAGVVPLTSQRSIADQVEQVARQVGLERDEADDQNDVDNADQDVVPEEIEEENDQADVDVDERPARAMDLDILRLELGRAGRIVCVANFVMFISAVLYCLILLMNLKISLTGKLGGINHFSRAFFQSLFIVVFITPWQILLPGVVLGAMYMPGELLCGMWAGADDSTLWTALFYLRFTGYWLLVVWLLLCAQMRSVKWARATLRRLGMTR